MKKLLGTLVVLIVMALCFNFAYPALKLQMSDLSYINKVTYQHYRPLSQAWDYTFERNKYYAKKVVLMVTNGECEEAKRFVAENAMNNIGLFMGLRRQINMRCD